jgi:hypothetical protein
VYNEHKCDAYAQAVAANIAPTILGPEFKQVHALGVYASAPLGAHTMQMHPSGHSSQSLDADKIERGRHRSITHSPKNAIYNAVSESIMDQAPGVHASTLTARMHLPFRSPHYASGHSKQVTRSWQINQAAYQKRLHKLQQQHAAVDW